MSCTFRTDPIVYRKHTYCAEGRISYNNNKKKKDHPREKNKEMKKKCTHFRNSDTARWSSHVTRPQDAVHLQDQSHCLSHPMQITQKRKLSPLRQQLEKKFEPGK